MHLSESTIRSYQTCKNLLEKVLVRLLIQSYITVLIFQSKNPKMQQLYEITEEFRTTKKGLINIQNWLVF